MKNYVSVFDIFKIRPSLTTSKEGLKRLNIHLETTNSNSELD